MSRLSIFQNSADLSNDSGEWECPSCHVGEHAVVALEPLVYPYYPKIQLLSGSGTLVFAHTILHDEAEKVCLAMPRGERHLLETLREIALPEFFEKLDTLNKPPACASGLNA